MKQLYFLLITLFFMEYSSVSEVIRAGNNTIEDNTSASGHIVDQSKFENEAKDRSVLKCAELYRKREYDDAYKKCFKPARNGNAVAQTNLGFIQSKRSSMGRQDGNTISYGLEEGEDNANTWFLRAANQGYAFAQYELSNNGGGLGWKIKAAKNGYSIAQMALGEFYENTEQSDPNYKLAVYWYEKAAAQGVPYAQKRLQIIYDKKYAKKTDAAEIVAKMSPKGSVEVFINAIQVNSNWVEPGDEQSETLYAKGKKIANGAVDFMMGKSTEKVDIWSSVPFFRQAAKWGNAKATYMMASMQPIPKNDAERDQIHLEEARLYKLSAEMGYVDAQDKLADLYNLGDKINKSYPQAKAAADHGFESAKKQLVRLRQKIKMLNRKGK